MLGGEELARTEIIDIKDKLFNLTVENPRVFGVVNVPFNFTVSVEIDGRKEDQLEVKFARALSSDNVQYYPRCTGSPQGTLLVPEMSLGTNWYSTGMKLQHK